MSSQLSSISVEFYLVKLKMNEMLGFTRAGRATYVDGASRSGLVFLLRSQSALSLDWQSRSGEI